MGIYSIHRKLPDFSFDWSEGRGDADYRHRCWSPLDFNRIGSRGAGSYRLSALSALSIFDMGNTDSRATRPLVGRLRGALALALALALPPTFPLYNEILITAFGVVVFSVVVQDLTMPLLLRKLTLLPNK